MFKNFYITALRNLYKHKGYFLLNIVGLVIGISSFLFISLYIINELSYDRFHSQSERMFRVHVKGLLMGQNLDMAVTASPMARALINDYPEVEKVTQVKESGAWVIGYEDRRFNEDGVLFADSAFFDVFDFNLLEGDPKTALSKPKSMVLTQTFARKYFGDESALGKRITVEQDTNFYEITGVMEDVPDNSHFKFDMLGSRSTYQQWDNNFWVSHNEYTYMVLKENTDAEDLENKIQNIVYKYVGPQISEYLGTTMEAWEAEGNFFGYYLMPVTDIHLRSNVEDELEPNSHISYIYIYTLIAIILLSIAIINFVNLSTAQSAARSKEVGIRKVIGSTRKRLIYQFIIESIFISLLATVIAAILVEGLTPNFEELINKGLAIRLSSSLLSVVVLLALAMVIGILSGFYPAFVLAGFRPAEVLKGRLKTGARSSLLRNILVIVQFTSSIVIIIGTLAVYRQIDYMLNKNLGFDKEQVVVVRRPDVLRKNLETCKTELLRNPNIVSVANALSIPGKERYNNNAYLTEDNPESPYLLMENWVSFEYAEVMGLEILEGRFFDRSIASDSNGVIVNESAVKTLGYSDPINKNFIDRRNDGTVERKTPIIGVVKDFHIQSLHRPIEPSILRLMPGNWEGYMLIKLSSTKNVNETLQFIEETWYQYSNNKPFQYFFFDDDYAELYASESTTGKIFVVFTGISICIACLGLIGLITYTTSIRKKEIGIRKTMGAGTGTLVKLLSKEFFQLMLISTILGWPIAYFGVNYWLRNFADRLAISPWYFIVASMFVTMIGAAAISYQTIRTSLSNPVDSLRQE